MKNAESVIEPRNLVNLFQGKKRGAEFASLIVKREAKELRKTSKLDGSRRPWETVYVVQRVLVCIGAIYENSVNRQRAREALGPEAVEKFSAQALPYGEWIEGTPFIQHKGKVYLRAQQLRYLSYEYRDEAGKVLTKEQVEPFKGDKAPSKSQGVENPVEVRAYTVENIKALQMRGMKYIVA